jgi:Xaa-Pro dipeptidase
MAIHFSEDELAARRAQACKAMERQGLDGMLIFLQESMYWLTGYDTFGYCFFQAFYLGADGRFFLMTRAPDLRQAQHTSVIEDIRVWVDRDGAQPADQLREILEEYGVKGHKLGVEYDAPGLTAHRGKMVEASLEGFCTLTPANELINDLRVVKSEAELAYIRRAGELADDAYDAAVAVTAAGVDEGLILSRMQGAVFEGGGDYAGNEFIIGSDRDALLCRYKSGRRALSAQDQLTLEWAGSYRRYHAAMMNTFIIGKPTPEHQAMYTAGKEALLACEETLRPGNTVGDVFDTHARVLDGHGLRPHRMNACGYSMSARYTPCWMDWPMFYAGNPRVLEANMAFFIHIIIVNSDKGLGMCLGRSSILTEGGSETVSRSPLDMVVL